MYPIDSFQDNLTWFLHCVPNWLLSRQFDLNLSLCTQLTPFKTIWPNFIIVYPNDSSQDHITWFLHCVPNWLLSRPFDLISSLCTQLTPFKTIWPDFSIVGQTDSFQDHLAWKLQIFYLKTGFPIQKQQIFVQKNHGFSTWKSYIFIQNGRFLSKNHRFSIQNLWIFVRKWWIFHPKTVDFLSGFWVELR